MAETILVNFRKAIPLFPLSDVVLLPHALLPLHIFEPRYRQMVGESLDGAGQIAIATVDGEPDGAAPVRPVACVGQIIHHQSLPDGRYNIWLHGVCRARIKQVVEPERPRTYRLARLAPIDPVDGPTSHMPEIRELLRRRLSGPQLRRLRDNESFLEWIERDDVPTHALVELIGSRLLPGPEQKYEMLAEPNPRRRARLVLDQLSYLEQLLMRTSHQNHEDWPKGVSWN